MMISSNSQPLELTNTIYDDDDTVKKSSLNDVSNGQNVLKKICEMD